MICCKACCGLHCPISAITTPLQISIEKNNSTVSIGIVIVTFVSVTLIYEKATAKHETASKELK